MMADPRKDEETTTIKVASAKKHPVLKEKHVNGPIKLKKPAPKLNKAGNWQEGSIVQDKKRSSSKTIPGTTEVPSPGPVVNQLDENARETFATGRPLEDSPDLQQCKLCKKSILRTAATEHINACIKIKKEKAQRKKEAREARERAREAERKEELRKNGGGEDGAGGEGADDDSDDDDDGPAGKKPNAGKTTSKKVGGKKTDVGGKKRKAENDAEKAPKAKKKKDEPKAKGAKPKGPVDVERQCGVLLPNGQPCARSLTCKSHSMGAKRAVPGRSLPYDMLLAAYQKKNQAKLQKAALDANAPVEEDDDPNVEVDSDEETAAVMNALAHWNPQPLVPQPVFAPIRREYQLARLHEQLQTATNGGRLSIFRVVRPPDPQPDLYADIEDAPGEPDTAPQGPFSRRSSGYSAMSGVQPAQRQASISGRA